MFGVCDALVGLANGCVAMGSLWIVNQVLVRFGRAGRLGGFDRAAQAVGLGFQGWSVTGRHGLSDLVAGDRVSGAWGQMLFLPQCPRRVKVCAE